MLTNDAGYKTTVLLGGVPVPVGRFGIAGHRLDDPTTDELIARGYSGMNPASTTPPPVLTTRPATASWAR